MLLLYVCNVYMRYCISIASWVLAVAAFTAWYQYDKKKEREFSASELQTWNQEVLRKHPSRSLKNAQSSASSSSSTTTSPE